LLLLLLINQFSAEFGINGARSIASVLTALIEFYRKDDVSLFSKVVSENID
jgi:hypothetical protein